MPHWTLNSRGFDFIRFACICLLSTEWLTAQSSFIQIRLFSNADFYLVLFKCSTWLQMFRLLGQLLAET